MPPHDPSFIEEMKKRLLEEQVLLRQELGVVAEKSSDEGYVTKFPDYGRDEESNAMEVADYAAAAAVTQATHERLKAVEEALARIEAGTYGVTEDGTPIPEKRLQANPAATTLA